TRFGSGRRATMCRPACHCRLRIRDLLDGSDSQRKWQFVRHAVGSDAPDLLRGGSCWFLPWRCAPVAMPRTCSGVLHAPFDLPEREGPRSKSGASKQTICPTRSCAKELVALSDKSQKFFRIFRAKIPASVNLE